ncbi:MAG: DUF4442 domain-containing protein [Ginsengibacter sp.]
MSQFLKLVKHPIKFRLYLLYNLPAAFFSGIKIRECTEKMSITSVPFKWLTQNPFKSTYFASLAMAAEMSTGMLALNSVYKRTPPISMLVTNMEASYFKKATHITYFTCEDGMLITNAVNEAAKGGEGIIVSAKSTGRNKEGEMIAEFIFTWSFRQKAKERI